MTYPDWIVLAILVVSGGLAWMRGFMRELLSIGGWVVAGVATVFGLPAARPIGRQYIGNELLADVATGAVIFVVTLIVCSVIGHFIAKRVQDGMLGPVDRSLGLLFGLVRGALIVAALMLGVDYFLPADKRPPEIADALTLPLAVKGAELLKAMIPGSLIDQAEDTAQQAQQQGQMVIDVGRTTGLLPEQLLPEPAAPGDGESPGSAGDSGYKDAERKDLNRLIQGTQ